MALGSRLNFVLQPAYVTEYLHKETIVTIMG